MRRLTAVLVLVTLAVLAGAPEARAGASTDAALALGAFAVFNQIVRGETIFHDLLLARPVVRQTVVVQPPPAVVYAPPPPVIYAPPPVVYYAPPPPPVVIYRWDAPARGFAPPGHARKFYGRSWTH